MKKKLVIAFVLFSSIGAALFYFLTVSNIGAKYNTAEVRKREVSVFVEEVGRISSKSIRRYFGSGTNKIEALPLELGDLVEEGQLLVNYKNHLDLETQKVRKQIEALEAIYRDALSGTDVESANSAKIEIARIRNDIALARKNKDRIEALYNSGAATLVDLEQAVNNIEQLQSSLATAQNTYSQLVKGVSVNTKKRYEAEIDVLLLTLETIERNRDHYRVYADTEGIVTELGTFVGDTPAPGSLMLEIQDPNRKVVLVDFMVEDARKITPGMKAKVEDQNLGITIDQLQVDQVYPKAFVTLSELGVEENRQTVEISLPASSDDYAFGLELKTKVMIDESREALLIPVSAVYRETLCVRIVVPAA